MAIVWQVYLSFTVKIGLRHVENLWQWHSELAEVQLVRPRGFPLHPASSHASRLHQLRGDRGVEFPALGRLCCFHLLQLPGVQASVVKVLVPCMHFSVSGSQDGRLDMAGICLNRIYRFKCFYFRYIDNFN